MRRKHKHTFRPRLQALEGRDVPSGGPHEQFGPDGRVTTDFIGSVNDYGDGIAVQADGKTIVVGAAGHDFGIARYNADGSLDAGFGTGGRVSTNFVGELPGQGEYDHAWSAAVQPDGKIVVAGVTAGDWYFTSAFAVARYNSDGTLDAGFGAGGMVTTSVDDEPYGLSEARAVAIQPDGKVVAGGFLIDFNTFDYALALVRYNVDGSLDTSFGVDGIVITDAGGSYEDIRSIALQPDGKIVVSGELFNNGVGGDFLLVRYNPDGTPDAGFGTGGIARTSFGFESWTNFVTVLPNGSIMAVGGTVSTSFGPADFAIARYLPNGALDAGFGAGGKIVKDFGGSEYAEGLAVKADGSFVVTGTRFDDATGDGDFAMAGYAATGAPDAGFGAGGTVITDLGFESDDQAEAGCVRLSDGRIVAAGFAFNPATATYDFALARYHSDGSLDSSFDTDGLVITNFDGSQEDSARAVAIQLDGKTVAAGESSGRFALVRYNVDGTVDPSFGDGGRVATDIGLSSSARGVVIQPDGKILAAGTAFSPYSGSDDFALARYNADGSLDLSFGSGGTVTTDFDGVSDQGAGIALMSDGTIVVAGASDGDFAVARYLANGSPDTSFDTDGKLTTDLGGFEFGGSVAVRPDGRITVAGTTFNLGTFEQDFAVVRYLVSGELDGKFGVGGTVIGDLGGGDFIADIALQPDGKTVIAGGTFDFAASIQYFALVRLNEDGSQDSGFGTDGVVTTDFLPPGALFSDQAASSVAIMRDGRIVAAGHVEGFTGLELIEGFAVARYLSDGSLDGKFDGDGKVVIDFGVRDTAWDVAIGPRASVVVAGDAIDPSNGSLDFALARYNDDGSPDVDGFAPRGLAAFLPKQNAEFRHSERSEESTSSLVGVNRFLATLGMTDPRNPDSIIPPKPSLPVVDRVQGLDLSLGMDPFDDDGLRPVSDR